MSATPRTEALARTLDSPDILRWDRNGGVVPADFARALERQLNEASHYLRNMSNDSHPEETGVPELLRIVFRELWEDRTQYLRKLEKLRSASMDFLYRYQNKGLISQLGGDSMTAVVDRMKKALEETKPDFE